MDACADARRVAVAAAEQAVRLDGYHTFKALPPNQTDSNATSRVSESLLAGDSHYLRCNWELSKQCYMDAGAGVQQIVREYVVYKLESFLLGRS